MKARTLATLALCLIPTTLHAAVSELTAADVTPRSFALVWVSDESVLDAQVSVFADADGTVEITDSVSRRVVSADFPPALNRGVVQMQIAGLSAGSCVYVQTRTTTAGGTSMLPAAPPFFEVCTTTRITRRGAGGSPIANDLLRIDATAPDGVATPEGALVLVEAPDFAGHPVSGFVIPGGQTGEAIVNLNNLVDPATGATAEIPDGAILRIKEFRGLHCPELDDHLLLRYRTAPPHEEIVSSGARLSQLEAPVACPTDDTVCDGVVDVRDAQRVLNAHGATLGQCGFHPDLDLASDGTIDDQDARALLDGIVGQ